MVEIQATIARVAEQAGRKLFKKYSTYRTRQRISDDMHPTLPVEVADRFLAEINTAEAQRLITYIRSPDFEEIARQLTLGRALNNVAADELLVHVRDEIRFGITRNVNLRPALRYTGTDVLYYSLLASVDENVSGLVGNISGPILATTAQASAIAAANSRLLRDLDNLAEVHDFSDKLRTQVRTLHGFMRTPHLGASSQPVPYDQLYIEPVLTSAGHEPTTMDPHTFAQPGTRTVIVGDPGAGKSTFAAKFAHDIASDLIDGVLGRLPFLLILRNFSAAMREGNNSLLHYLEQVCRNPYNLEPPRNAVEYLLRNGRAVVILDGIDELVDPELRRNVVQLVHGFAVQYPLVPILVTARRIGYLEAPLPIGMFTLGGIAELNDRQVRQYAENWFRIDVNTPDSESHRLAETFMSESKDISELRANPLLLALLCSMYSSEHYIPHNLAQIYEKCALMLFERWDKMRGIAMPLQFQGQLRGAVQYLAWQLASSHEPDKGLPGQAVVRILANYLVTKKFDEDEAVATATEFLEFCTGRAWILTDVGATRNESRYGFAHRTFLEYFSAEHLVRTHPAAEKLWEALQPRVIAGGWDVAGQIALQLLDRNVDGGVDELLRRATTEPAAGGGLNTLRVHTFAADALGYVHPSRDVIETVVATAVRDAFNCEPAHPFGYWITKARSACMYAANNPFGSLRKNCLPANSSIFDRIITQTIESLFTPENSMACFAIESFARADWPFADHIPEYLLKVSRRLFQRHPEVFHEARTNGPWSNLCWDPDPIELVRRFGPSVLYLSCIAQTHSAGSIVKRMLFGRYADSLHVDEEQLGEALTSTPDPWITDDRWWTEFPTGIEDVPAIDTVAGWGFSLARKMAVVPVLLLLLPYLEAKTQAHFSNLSVPNVSDVAVQLGAARLDGVVKPHLERLLRVHMVPDHARLFLIEWARGERSVLGPPPQGR